MKKRKRAQKERVQRVAEAFGTLSLTLYPDEQTRTRTRARTHLELLNEANRRIQEANELKKQVGVILCTQNFMKMHVEKIFM